MTEQQPEPQQDYLASIKESLEVLQFSMWNEGVTGKFGLLLSRSGLEVMKKAWGPHRFYRRKEDGELMLMSPMGGVIIREFERGE